MLHKIWLGVIFPLLASLSNGLAPDHGHNLTAQAATELALLYAYPLLAFQLEYTTLASRIGVNHMGHARQLSTPQNRATVKPNVDTVYSVALFDLSAGDVLIDIPEVPADQYALFSFHDLYGDNFALFGPESFAAAGTFCLGYGKDSSNASGGENASDSCKEHVQSPTTFGVFLIRWLVKSDNINAIHSLQNATGVKTDSRELDGDMRAADETLRLSSAAWNSSASSPAETAIKLLCQVEQENTPGKIAGNASVQDALSTAGFCAHNLASSAAVDLNAANRTALAAANTAGQKSLEHQNNGWSTVKSNLTGTFGDDYGLRAQIASTGYLMLQAPAAVYPSWTNNTVAPPMQGEVLELGAGQSYIYSFSGKPPLRELGFWSLTAYAEDGFLIENLRNVYALGDRSNITYPSGAAVYGNASSAEDDGEFKLLIQPADVTPPTNWTGNWLPGPSGGGNMSVLLRFYEATEDLLEGNYQYPVVSKQEAIRAVSES